jgi:protein-S-isoprenylcysteine O-methyltransferase Ste14
MHLAPRRFLIGHVSMSAIPHFVSATFVFGFATLVFRGLVRREYRIRGYLRLRTSLCQLLAFIFWAYFGFRQLPPSWPVTESHLIWKVIGWPLFVGGFMAMFVAMFDLGGATMFGLRRAKVKVSGFYRISRNPQASALLLALLGHMLLWPTWRMNGALLLCLPMLHMMILTEEEHLTRALGDEYREYQWRVPRYLLKFGNTSRPAT